MRPAFGVGAAAHQLPYLAGGRRHPQKLNVVARIRLVHRGADDGAAIETLQILVHVLRRPTGIGQRYIEERLLGHFLVRPGRVHGCRRQRAHERRRLLHDGRHLRRNRHDVLRLDKIAQTAQHVAKGAEQFVRRGMVVLQILQDGFHRTRGVDPFRHPLHFRLIAVQILIADFQQPVERCIDHLVVQQLLPVVVGADAEVPLRARQQVVLQKSLVRA